MTYCPKCGAGATADSRTCSSCGNYLQLAPVTPVAPTRPDPAQTTARQAPAGAGRPPQATAYAWPQGLDARTAQPNPAPYQVGAPAPGASGLILMPGEQVVREVWFSPNVLLPHLRTLVALTNQRVVIRHPHTILGFVPLGYWESSAKRSAVATIAAGTRMRTERLLFGGSAALFGLFQLFTSFGGYFGLNGVSLLLALVSLAVAGYLFVTARITGLIVFADGVAHTAAARGSELASVEQTAADLIRSMLEHHG